MKKIGVRRNGWWTVQPANFNSDPIDVVTRRMVKTEKALDYFGGNDFRCLTQSTNFHPVSQGTVVLSWPVMGFPYTRPFHENPIPSAPLIVESRPIPM